MEKATGLQFYYVTADPKVNLWPSRYMQDMREIPAIVNEKIVTSFEIFILRAGGTLLIMALANGQTN